MKRLTSLLVVAVGLVLASVMDFVQRTRTNFEPTVTPLPGVVFTGQFNRVYTGLALLERGALSPLLISGTNRPAGITIEKFVGQFKLSPKLQAGLADGTLVLSAGAHNTFENAAETRRWLATLHANSPVVLVTSRFHLPRASLALEKALAGRVVLRVGVPEDSASYRIVLIEWGKFVWTRVVGEW